MIPAIRVAAACLAVFQVVKMLMALSLMQGNEHMSPPRGAGKVLLIALMTQLGAVVIGDVLLELGVKRRDTSPGVLLMLGGAAIWVWTLL